MPPQDSLISLYPLSQASSTLRLSDKGREDDPQRCRFLRDLSLDVQTVSPFLRELKKIKLAWPTLLVRLLQSSRHRFPRLAQTSPWLARLVSLMDLPPALLVRLAGGLDHIRGLLPPDFLRQFKGYGIYQNYYRVCGSSVFRLLKSSTLRTSGANFLRWP